VLSEQGDIDFLFDVKMYGDETILIESHIHVSDHLIEKLPAQLPIERWFDICEPDFKRSIRYRSTAVAQQVRKFFRNLVR
jgi:hypothetical protein